MIGQIVFPKLQGDCQLQGVESAQAQVECIPFDEQLGGSKFGLSYRKYLQLSGRNIASELAQTEFCILTADGLRSNFNRESRCYFSHGQTGNPDAAVRSVSDLVDGWRSGLNMVELD